MRIYHIIFALLAGIFVTLSLKPFELWPLALLSTGLLFACLQGKSLKQTFFLTYLYSVSMFLTGASWVYVSIHDFGYTSTPVAALLTLLFCMALAAINACIWLCLLASTNAQTTTKTNSILLFAAVGTLTESLRGWVFTGFPWLFLGYSQTESLLSGWAPIIGVYGISFLLYLSGAIIVNIGKQAKVTTQIIPLCIVIACWAAGPWLTSIQWTRPYGDPLTVSMVQANISQHDKWRPGMLQPSMKLYQEMSQSSWQNSDIVIWPEAAIPADYNSIKTWLDDIGSRATQYNSALLTGIPFREVNLKTGYYESRNSVVGAGLARGIYHKQRLVPFGEYVPFEQFFGRLMHVFKLPMSSMGSGSKNQDPITIKDWRTRPLICYEIVYPDLTAKSAKISDVLITISNDSWFGNSLGPIQHLQMAQMRALENGRYLLRSTGNGVSAIVDAKGRILTQSEQFKRQLLSGEFHLTQGNTPWTLFGHWLIHYLLLTLLVIIIAVERIKKSHQLPS